jgi:hypothetical protein
MSTCPLCPLHKHYEVKTYYVAHTWMYRCMCVCVCVCVCVCTHSTCSKPTWHLQQRSGRSGVWGMTIYPLGSTKTQQGSKTVGLLISASGRGGSTPGSARRSWPSLSALLNALLCTIPPSLPLHLLTAPRTPLVHFSPTLGMGRLVPDSPEGSKLLLSFKKCNQLHLI